jgi:ribonuclease P protein component
MQVSLSSGPTRVGRLLRRADFVAASRGARWNCEAFGLQMRRRPEASGSEPPRFGITVTKKTAAGAVERNRIRRRLREALRLGAALPAQVAHDYVVVGRRPVLGLSFEDLRSRLAAGVAAVGAAGTRRRGKRDNVTSGTADAG